MADSVQLRNRRAYRHRQGDHSLCRPERCPVAAGKDGRPVAGLLDAVRAEFAAADPLVRSLALRLAELAGGGGAAAVAATRALAELAAAERES